MWSCIDDGARRDAAGAARAGAGIGVPRFLRRAVEREIARRVVGLAAGLRPILIGARRRQQDRRARVGKLAGDDVVLRLHHGDALAGQRHGLLGEGVQVRRSWAAWGRRHSPTSTARAARLAAGQAYPPRPTPHALSSPYSFLVPAGAARRTAHSRPRSRRAVAPRCPPSWRAQPWRSRPERSARAR